MDEYERWRSSPVLTAEQRAELSALDEREKNDRFYRNLAFGTAGLRGVTGMGTNRMNEYVVRQATTALARVLLAAGTAAQGVCIGCDCRLGARMLAEEAAWALRCCGVPVFLFAAPRPTPELSFAVRTLGAAAGINVTASHNPREYNGYKVYWSDGAQLPPDRAALVAEEMAHIDVLSPRPAETELCAPLTVLGADMDERYMNAVARCACAPGLPGQTDLRVVYTAFHGVGGAIVPEVLRRQGLKDLFFVEEQMAPDGRFPTLPKPNPEEPGTMALAEARAREVGADLVLATDPDSDRIGVAVRDEDGGYVELSGNRVGALLTDYLLRARAEQGTLPPHPCIIQTLVTSELSRRIAEDHGAACFVTFTGFKYMAERLAALEREGVWQYLLAYEEAIGYMTGDHARDKDGVAAALLLCEMAAWYRLQGRTLLDGLRALWARHGYFDERTVSVQLPGADGMKRMADIMASLRRDPPAEVVGRAVTRMRDHLSGQCSDGTAAEPVGSDVLVWELDGGSRVVVRPSGTEPKLKIYALARADGERQAAALAESIAAQMRARCER